MIVIDGKVMDLTNPASWGNAIQIMPGGSITTIGHRTKVVIQNTQPQQTQTPSTHPKTSPYTTENKEQP